LIHFYPDVGSIHSRLVLEDFLYNRVNVQLSLVIFVENLKSFLEVSLSDGTTVGGVEGVHYMGNNSIGLRQTLFSDSVHPL